MNNPTPEATVQVIRGKNRETHHLYEGNKGFLINPTSSVLLRENGTVVLRRHQPEGGLRVNVIETGRFRRTGGVTIRRIQ